jgi:hypothetical protein
MLKAERQFRRIIGYRDLAKLVVAIERGLPGRLSHSDEGGCKLVGTDRRH